MNRGGFTLVELIAVIAVAAILLSIAMLQFNRFSLKGAIENQTKIMFTDLMTVRSEALFEKRRRAVKLTATTFAVYSSGLATGTPVLQKSLRYPLVFNGVPDPVIFNGRGLIEGVSSGAMCIEPSGNPGVIDSIVLDATRIQMGKRDGTACQTSDIDTK